MKLSLLRGNGLKKNIIFDLNNDANRDNCFAPYVLMKEVFYGYGIQVNTADVIQNRSISFELHQDIQFKTQATINYLLMFETGFVKIEHNNFNFFSRYKKIFTWNDDLVDGNRFIKINFPNPIQVHPVDGFKNRNRFCCLIAANKTLAVVDGRDLYLERVKTIRWFEKNAPTDFDLYGIGWHIPAWGRGKLGKLLRRLFGSLSKLIPIKPFPSYRGKVEHKKEVLTNTRFAICYENVKDLPGYITEKIFDCFFSGCIPVYWGANNITDYIPANCFVDRRQFEDHEALYYFLKAITEAEFKGYQQHISDFLQSDKAYPFSADFFAKTIVETIVNDLGS